MPGVTGAPLYAKPSGPSMTSHSTRPPSPSSLEDVRVPSSPCDDSPLGPTNASPRRDEPIVPHVVSEDTPMPDHPADSAVPLKTPEASPVDPSSTAVPASAQTSTEVTTNSAPLETVVPPAAKDVAPSSKVVAPAEVPAKIKKVVAAKHLPSQKGPTSSSQPSIADMLHKGILPLNLVLPLPSTHN